MEIILVFFKFFSAFEIKFIYLYFIIKRTMANITETETPQLTINGQVVDVTRQNVFQFIKNLVDKGFRACKALTIKDGALLHKYFEILIGTVKPKEKDIEPKKMYQVIQRAIHTANTEGAYDTNDAAVLDKLMTFVDETFPEVSSETGSVQL